MNKLAVLTFLLKVKKINRSDLNERVDLVMNDIGQRAYIVQRLNNEKGKMNIPCPIRILLD